MVRGQVRKMSYAGPSALNSAQWRQGRATSPEWRKAEGMPAIAAGRERPGSGPYGRRPGALLQRGGRDRQGGGGFPRRPAGRHDLRLRQQFHRPHRRGRAPGRRRGRPRDAIRARATWCGGCSPTWTPTSIVLVDGDATYDAASARALIARLIEDRLDMVVAARIHRDEAAYRRGPSVRQPAVLGVGRLGFQRDLQRHPVGLPGVLAAICEIVSGLSRGFEIEIELAVHALELELPIGRDSDALLRASGRLGVEAQHLARRLSHSLRPSSISIAPSGRWRFSAASAACLPSSRSVWRSRSSRPI